MFHNISYYIFYMYYNIKIINAQAKITCFLQEHNGETITLENIYNLI
jgi:hypothetical protein